MVVTEAAARHIIKNGSHHLLFDLEGDSCRIKFNESMLTYHRRGMLTYKLDFIKGRETTAEMTAPYGITGIQCKTKAYEMRSKDGEIVLDLRYNVADEEYEMQITVGKNKTMF